jgi:hypothetical protein
VSDRLDGKIAVILMKPTKPHFNFNVIWQFTDRSLRSRLSFFAHGLAIPAENSAGRKLPRCSAFNNPPPLLSKPCVGCLHA